MPYLPCVNNAEVRLRSKQNEHISGRIVKPTPWLAKFTMQKGHILSVLYTDSSQSAQLVL